MRSEENYRVVKALLDRVWSIKCSLWSIERDTSFKAETEMSSLKYYASHGLTPWFPYSESNGEVK